MRRNRQSFILGRNHVCNVTMHGHEFPSGERLNSCGYQTCIWRVSLGLNAMHMVDDIGPRQVEGPWDTCSGQLSLLLGCCLVVRAFKKLLDAMVQSVLLYGAEACMGLP